MLSDLNNFFTSSNDNLARHKCIGVWESRADSAFLFHHFISYFLKNRNRVFVLSFRQSFSHFNNAGNKIGSNLTEEKKNSNLVFIEGLKHLGAAVNFGCATEDPWRDAVNELGAIVMRNLFRVLKSTIDSFDSSSTPVFIIDDLSLLTDLGAPVKDLISFIQYMVGYVIHEKDGHLIAGVNNDCGEEDEEGTMLWKALQYHSDLAVEVKGLETGYCKDVHGQISAVWGSSSVREKPTVKEAQFKLTDKTCSLFASGMSSAVL